MNALPLLCNNEIEQKSSAKQLRARAYGNKEFSVSNGFVFYVSIFRQFDSRTGRSWQNVGVKPDIDIPAEKALGVAHLEAIKKSRC